MIIDIENKREYQRQFLDQFQPSIFLAKILLLDISCDDLCGKTLSSGCDVVNHLAWQPDITPNIALKKCR